MENVETKSVVYQTEDTTNETPMQRAFREAQEKAAKAKK